MTVNLTWNGLNWTWNVLNWVSQGHKLWGRSGSLVDSTPRRDLGKVLHSQLPVALHRGVHPPEAILHVLLFQIPSVSEKILTPWKISQIVLFPKIFSIFIRQNFWWPFFFSYQPQISNFPLFSLFQYISPLFWQNYSFLPAFKNVPPCFREIYVFFYILYVFFVSPYFYHDAVIHHTMHCWTPLALQRELRHSIHELDWIGLDDEQLLSIGQRRSIRKSPELMGTA